MTDARDVHRLDQELGAARAAQLSPYWPTAFDGWATSDAALVPQLILPTAAMLGHLFTETHTAGCRHVRRPGAQLLWFPGLAGLQVWCTGCVDAILPTHLDNVQAGRAPSPECAGCHKPLLGREFQRLLLSVEPIAIAALACRACIEAAAAPEVLPA